MRLLFTLLGCVLLTSLSLTSRAVCDPGIISGPTTVCGGATITLTSSVGGGTWTSSGAASVDPVGVVTGAVTGGTATITYTVTDMSGTCMTTQVVTVNPTAVSITGPSLVCAGNAIILTATATGGVWSSSNPAKASVTSGGVVIGSTAGTTNISYTITNSCGTTVASQMVTVSTPVAGPLFGPGTVCQGATITLTSAVPGGTWSSLNPAIASVNSSTGVVTGHVASGTVISYTATNTCGTAVATVNVLVDPLPFAGSISGPNHVCAGTTITLTETVHGGTWTSSNSSVAPIMPTVYDTQSVVTGILAGTTNITYTVVNSCGPSFASMTVTVDPAAIAGPIAGPTGMCYPGTATLTGAMPGGTWSSSSPWIATVNSSGVVTSVAPGSVVIFYTINNSCGTNTAIKSIIIDTAISAGTISGVFPFPQICMGNTMTLSETVAGGTWYIGPTSIATITSGGVVTAVSPGTTTVYYSVANGCGGAVATQVLTVIPPADAGTLSGAASVCMGASIPFTSTVPGGTWTSSAPGIASVSSSSGSVSGVSGGTAIITYTATNLCGTATQTRMLSVDVTPVAGPVIGPDSVCIGDSIRLVGATLTGAWSSGDPSVASISTDAFGYVIGHVANFVSITYTVINSCGISTANKTVKVVNCKLGVEETAVAENISIFPNPAQNSINIRSSETIRNVEITNMLGEKVFSGTFNTGTATVNMENFAAGVYIIKVNEGNVYKIIKE